jgi:hypothetical protein
MPSTRARELWNSGIPLSRAWLEFAPPELRSEFENLPGFVGSLSATPKPETAVDFLSAFTNSLGNAHRRGQMEIDLKKRLLADLFSGQWVATGYRVAPSRSQAPVLIDPEKFERNDPDWSGDGFVAQGVTYCRIRVTDPANSLSAPARRNSSLDAIETAIDQLITANPGFCELERKVACQEIREFLGVKQFAGNGLSDKNLGKAIVRKCGPKRISK